MKDQLKILSQLQTLEQQKLLISGQKAKVNADEVRLLWQEVRLLGQNVAAAKEKLVCLEKVCARQEADLLAISKQNQQMEAKLYGGEITNLKELEQVKAKCDSVRKDITNREDEMFASLEQYELFKAQIIRDESLLQQQKRLHAEKQQKMTQALAGFDNQLAEITKDYNRLAEQVEPGLMAKFRELGRKIALPVARVENGVCSGCRMSIPTTQAVTSRTAVYCDNCGRILLVE